MRFSIVTPTRNSDRFLAQTVESVISQEGDFEIQYVIVDGQSADRTAEVAGTFQLMLEQGKLKTRCKKISFEFLSERDDSMYEAINRGFARSTGDVMCWINSDDVYRPGAFAAVSQAMRDYPDVAWLKGVTSYINESSEQTQAGSCYLYDQRWIEAGVYGPLFNFIQQDSVFWKSTLWERSGGIDSNVRLCGDYYLWRSFARYEPLYSLPCTLSCFRQHDAQLSRDIEGYWREASGKGPVPGIEKRRLLGRLLTSPKLPRSLRLLIRRVTMGVPDYRFLPRPSIANAGSETRGRTDVIEDRVTSAVIL